MSFQVISSKVFCSRVYNHKNCDCTICRQPLNEDSIYAKEENYISELVSSKFCGHTFHSECIKPWLTKYNKCPICAEKWQ